jgi:hypothetical protein
LLRVLAGIPLHRVGTRQIRSIIILNSFISQLVVLTHHLK